MFTLVHTWLHVDELCFYLNICRALHAIRNASGTHPVSQTPKEVEVLLLKVAHSLLMPVILNTFCLG